MNCQLALLLIMITVPIQQASAVFTLDWATASSNPASAAPQQWVYGAGTTTQTIQASDGMGGTFPVDFLFTGGPAVEQITTDVTTIEPGVQTPFVTSSNVSGFGEGLLFRIDPPDPSGVANPTADPSSTLSTNLPLNLTISFPTGPVYGLNFSIGDIDLQNIQINQGTGILTVAQHQDQVVVTSAAPYTATPTTSFISQSGGTFIAEPYIDGNGNNAFDLGEVVNNLGGTNNGDVPDTSGAANVDFSFPGPVSSLTIAFGPAAEPESPTTVFTQWVSLSDLEFTNVPEPSSFLFMGLVGVGTLGFRRMRKSYDLEA